MALRTVRDGLVEHQMTDGTLQLIIDRVDEEGVDAHGFGCWVSFLPCLAALGYVGLWMGVGRGATEAADY